MQDVETLKFIIQLVLGVLLAPFAAVMWFLMRKLIADVIKLEKALSDMQLHMALHYVLKPDHDKELDAQRVEFVKALEVQKQDFDKSLKNQKEYFDKSFDAVFKKLDRIEDWARTRPQVPPL